MSTAKPKINIGIEKAKSAAIAVEGFVVHPEFNEDDKSGRPTDFNDIARLYGDEAVKIRIMSAVESVRNKMSRAGGAGGGGSDTLDVVSCEDADHPPLPVAVRSPLTISGNWRDRLICNGEGKLIKGSLQNIMLFLENLPNYKGVFRLNDFQKEIFITRCPPWENDEHFKVRRISECDITNCTADLEKLGITPESNKVFKAIAVVAENDKFHPAREYFNSLEWDGKKRLETWLSYYFGAEGDPKEYLAFIGKKWLTAAVKRVFEPGCKFDHMLVMEGLQGRGKSTGLEMMATFGDDSQEAYFTDNIKISDIQNKDTILLLQGSILVELAELVGFSKKDDDEIKGWITIKQDRCRKPYERTVSIFKRQFVLSATTNNYDYLKDPTGNRRYWPFKSSAVDMEAIKRDRAQLWAEAVHWYKDGLYIGPTEEEAVLATSAQNKRLSIDDWEDDVMQAAQNLGPKIYNGFKVRDVFGQMNITLRDRDYKSARRVSAILQTNGYINEVKWLDGKSQRVWVKQMGILHNPADEFPPVESAEQELEF